MRAARLWLWWWLLCAFGCASVALDSAQQRDVAYGSEAEQSMDVHAVPGGRAAPVVFMVHGGAWRGADKRDRDVVVNKVARWLPRGLIVVSVNYRMLPARDALQQRDDIVAALAFAQRHAAGWGGDPEQFVLMGHSSGAHLIALVNADPARAYRAGAQPWLGAIALDSAALDVPEVMQRRHRRLYDAAFGTDDARWREASPQHQLRPGSPPLLAVCSTKRRDLPCEQAQAYVAAAHALGTRAELLPQALSHGAVNDDLGEPGAYTEAVEAFMASLAPALQQRLQR